MCTLRYLLLWHSSTATCVLKHSTRPTSSLTEFGSPVHHKIKLFFCAPTPVSYTHLDVYKRQHMMWWLIKSSAIKNRVRICLIMSPIFQNLYAFGILQIVVGKCVNKGGSKSFDVSMERNLSTRMHIIHKYGDYFSCTVHILSLIHI